MAVKNIISAIGSPSHEYVVGLTINRITTFFIMSIIINSIYLYYHDLTYNRQTMIINTEY